MHPGDFRIVQDKARESMLDETDRQGIERHSFSWFFRRLEVLRSIASNLQESNPEEESRPTWGQVEALFWDLFYM